MAYIQKLIKALLKKTALPVVVSIGWRGHTKVMRRRGGTFLSSAPGVLKSAKFGIVRKLCQCQCVCVVVSLYVIVVIVFMTMCEGRTETPMFTKKSNGSTTIDWSNLGHGRSIATANAP